MSCQGSIANSALKPKPKLKCDDKNVIKSKEDNKIVMKKTNDGENKSFTMNPRQQKYYDKFKYLLEKEDWKMISGLYHGADSNFEVECPSHHRITTSYHKFTNRNRKHGCKICTKKDKNMAELEFRQIISELGGKVIGEYKSAHIRVNCICPVGHDCEPIPGDVKRRLTMCKICSNKDSGVAEANFREAIREMGGEIIGKYKGYNTHVDCKCKNGHMCSPIPSGIKRGEGMCSICSKGESKSKGAANIHKYLIENKIDYRVEIRIQSISSRRFDFFIFYNNRPIIIEYDGRQHFNVSAYASEETFPICQEIDRLKTYAALIEGFTLIRIHNKRYDRIKKILDYCLSQDNTQNYLYVDNANKYEYIIETPVNEKTVKEKSNLTNYVPIDIKSRTRIVEV